MADDNTAPAPAADETKVLRVRGISERDYAAWKHHPVTRVFLRYMREYRRDLIANALEAWIERPLDSLVDMEMRGRAKTLDELADMPFEAIALFYAHIDEANAEQKPTNEDDDEAETD